MADNMEYNYKEEPKAGKLRKSTNLVARVVTLAFITVSMVVIKTNSVKILGSKAYSYKDVYTYRYALFVMVISFLYTVVQIPFAIYHAKTGKCMINHPYALDFDFYADKVISLLLATAAGALFGATVDIRHNVLEGYSGNDELKSKFADFFQMGYVAAGFLLIAFISASFSSIISSLALSRKP